MNREILIQQVKDQYARLAELASRSHITDQTYSGVSPEAYFEQALGKAIRDISAGKYDHCISGQQVVEQIANHKTKTQRIQDTIESTLHNMEVTQAKIDSGLSPDQAQDLKAENHRRAEVIPEMIRKMKEEQAREELDVNSPKVIGGGSV